MDNMAPKDSIYLRMYIFLLWTGGLMGSEVLPSEIDAVEKYEVFEITQDFP